MLSGVILTYNEARHVADCVASLRWADEVVVFDSFSTDGTVEIAQNAGARVLQHPFANYAQQRNAALELVEADWVFFVDADERATPELAAEIRDVLRRDENGWWVPRHNYIFGRLTKGAGWYPDYQMRLLRRARARYDPAREVHELVILEGKAGHLTHPLIHYNYDTVAEFTARQTRYTDYDARILYEQAVRPKPRNYILQPLRHFYWRYVTLGGYREGLHGLRLSALMAYYNLEVYRRLARLWSDSSAAAGELG
jgi:glycosyltransferase involved in cell wall biosynthesis